MSAPLFRLTDGTTTVDLMAHGGFSLASWEPASPALKGGGVWRDSPLSDGRVLVFYRYQNVTERLTVVNEGYGQNQLIRAAQDADRLLTKALQYWTAEWQDEPVWIEARGPEESNVRYAVIRGYGLPRRADPYQQPFWSAFVHSAEPDLELLLEHGPWQAYEPGQAGALALDSTWDHQSGSPSADSLTVYVAAEPHGDGNAIGWLSWTDDPTDDYLDLSLDADGDPASVSLGFPATALGADRRVSRAVLNLYWWSVYGPYMNARVYCEDDGDPTYIGNTATDDYFDFIERTRTAEFVPWRWTPKGTEGRVSNYRFCSPNLAHMLNAVLSRSDWASSRLNVFLQSSRDGNEQARIADSNAGSIYYAQLRLWHYQRNANYYVHGRSSSTAREHYLANFCVPDMSFSDAMYYDASAGTYTTIDVDASNQRALLPSPVEQNDCLYLGVWARSGVAGTSAPTEGPPPNVVFDLMAANIYGASALPDFAWQYWDGSNWLELSGYDHTALNYRREHSISFRRGGVSSVAWYLPDDWAVRAVDAAYGYWVRCIRADARASVATRPYQQNRPIYVACHNYVEIASTDVQGDLPALAKVSLRLEGGEATRVFLGTRILERGADFMSILNAGPNSNPEGVTCELERTNAASDWEQTSGVATGECAVLGLYSDDDYSQKIVWSVHGDLSEQYQGTFRMFVRAELWPYVYAGVRCRGRALFYDHWADTEVQFWEGSPRYVYHGGASDRAILLELGKVSVPERPAGGYDELIFEVSFTSEGPNYTGVRVYDLVLLPVDEWSGEFSTPVGGPTITAETGRRVTLVVDSATDPARDVVARLEDESGRVLCPVECITSGPCTLQPRRAQRLHFLAARQLTGNIESVPVYRSNQHLLASVTMEIVERYSTMRGNR